MAQADLVVYIPGWILAAIAAVAGILTAWFLVTHRIIRPRFAVRLSDGSTTAFAQDNRPILLELEFENVGRGGKFPLRRDTLQQVSIAIYLPTTYKVVSIRRQNTAEFSIFEAPPKGRYSGTQLVFIPDPFDRKPPVMTSLRYGEVEQCKLEVIPSHVSPNGDEIRFDITSRQADVDSNSIWVKRLETQAHTV